MINKIKNELMDATDESYQKFSSSLIPNVDNMLGVRLPILRKLAKKISKNDYQTFFNQNNDEFFELTMLEAMVIGLLPYQEQLKYIEKFILKINNWSVCDSFCCGLKNFKTKQKELIELIDKYYSSDSEYLSRFSYVMMLNYLIDYDLNYVLEKIQKFNNNKYYAKMAAAWCLSVCIINNFDILIENIRSFKIEPWVIKKAITKAIESHKLSKAQKLTLKNLR